MKSYLHALVSLFFLTGTIKAQPVFEWVKNIGGSGTDVGLGITSDSDGNVLVCGRFETIIDADPGSGTANHVSAGSTDMLVVKFSPEGNYIWSKQIGGTGFDQFSDIATDQNGNILLLGSFEATVDLDPNAGVNTFTSAGGSDLLVLKLDPNGQTLWMHTISGTLEQETGGLDVQSTGEVYVCGGFLGTTTFATGTELTSLGENDVFVMKLNAAGNLSWVKQIGGTSFDYAYELNVDAGNNIVVGGRFRDVVDFNPGAATANSTSLGNNDGFVLKLNQAGDYLWHQIVGGAGFDDIWAITSDSDQNVLTFGYFSGTADLNPGAATQEFTSNGSDDLFIQKFSPTGTLLWVKVFGGSELENSYDIACDSDGNVIVIGDYFNTVDFDPGPATFNMTSLGNNDIYYLKLNADGNFVWASSIGSTFSQAGYCISINEDDEILSSGTFSNTVDFNPGTGVANLPSVLFNMYVLKFSNSCNLPQINSFNLSAPSVCAGEQVTVTINGSLNDASQWAIFSGGCGQTAVTNFTGNSTSITPEAGESYFIRGEGGCVSSSDLICTALNLNTNPVYALSQSFFVCPGEVFTFPDGSSQTINTSVSQTSSFQSISGCDSTILTQLEVTELPLEIIVGETSLTLANYNPKSSVVLQWINCETSLPIEGQNGPELLITGSGSFALIVTNNTCSDTTTCVTITNTENKTMLPVKVFPNPFSQNLTLQNLNPGSELSLYTIDGKCIAQEKADNSSLSWIFEEIGQGVYFLIIRDKQQVQQLKLIKQ